MGLRSRAILAGGLGFTAAFVVACGSSGSLLSGNQAAGLSRQLEAISSAIATGHCAQAASAASSLNDRVGNLPSSIDQTLVQDLAQGAGTVRELAAAHCSTSSSPSSTSSSHTSSTSTTKSSSTPTSTSTTNSTSSHSTSTAATSSTGATTSTHPGTTSSNGGAGLGSSTGSAPRANVNGGGNVNGGAADGGGNGQ